MSLPTIAIVGRPNVGKSSYLNAAIGRRISIVEATPGVTRDRVAVEIDCGDRTAILVDTGGIGVVDEVKLDDDIEGQIDIALNLADCLIFLVDAKVGITPLDQRVARLLRKLNKPIVFCANKIDHPGKNHMATEFLRLGLGEPLILSTKEEIGVQEALEQAFAKIEDYSGWGDDGIDPDIPRIAFVGKRNVGKSTILNLLAGEGRVIVSDIAGTTRDAVDVPVEYMGRKLVAIDTAGIMKKTKVKNSIDFYSQARSEAAIRRSNVVFFVLDPTTDISQVDKKISMQIIETGRPCVIVVNKWDLAKEKIDTGSFSEYIEKKLPGLHFAPVVVVSATEGKRLEHAIDVAFELHNQSSARVTTGELNRVIEKAFERKKPGGKYGYKAKIYFNTQVDRSPPTFVIFVNEPTLFPANYRRYIENRLREAFDFEEIPVHVFFRRRASRFHD
jgi:GTP-binding protein